MDFLVRASASMDFCCCLKIFPTSKHPKVTRLAFDCAQVLKWVLRNNCNCYLAFFLYFWTILTIRRYARPLKLWYEVPSKRFQTSLPQKLVTKDES